MDNKVVEVISLLSHMELAQVVGNVLMNHPEVGDTIIDCVENHILLKKEWFNFF